MQDTFQTPMEILKDFWNTPACEKAWAEYLESKSPKKEWEIVAYYFKPQLSSTKKPIIVDVNSGHWNNAKADDGETFGIHSVRRLSDGEVFSVGDRIKPTPTAARNRVIKSFSVHGDVLKIHDDDGYFYADEVYWHHMQKLPQPILTTVDGVEMFEGDKMYVVFDDFRAYQYSVNKKVFTELNENKKAPIIAFCSTSKAAEEWKLQNKPLLSLNDVKYALDSIAMSQNARDAAVDMLTAAVKQKLNQ